MLGKLVGVRKDESSAADLGLGFGLRLVELLKGPLSRAGTENSSGLGGSVLVGDLEGDRFLGTSADRARAEGTAHDGFHAFLDRRMLRLLSSRCVLALAVDDPKLIGSGQELVVSRNV